MPGEARRVIEAVPAYQSDVRAVLVACATRPPSPRRPSRRGGTGRGPAWGPSACTASARGVSVPGRDRRRAA
jgi:hypothetical protein